MCLYPALRASATAFSCSSLSCHVPNPIAAAINGVQSVKKRPSGNLSSLTDFNSIIEPEFGVESGHCAYLWKRMMGESENSGGCKLCGGAKEH